MITVCVLYYLQLLIIERTLWDLIESELIMYLLLDSVGHLQHVRRDSPGQRRMPFKFLKLSDHAWEADAADEHECQKRPSSIESEEVPGYFASSRSAALSRADAAHAQAKIYNITHIRPTSGANSTLQIKIRGRCKKLAQRVCDRYSQLRRLIYVTLR